MSGQALEVVSHGQLQTQQDWHSADQVLKRVRAIQQLMEAVMKKDTHFGVIPGTKMPTLYKAGSEQILSMFRLAVDPIVEDLSTEDECRIRVICRILDGSGKFLGAGVGECSSSEQKYKWRRVVSKAEWDWFKANSPDRTRLKFFGYFKNNKRIEGQEEQIRAEVPDVRNTILKMAKKRAQIDATLTVTGCSDMFQQDLEDLPEEIQQQVAEDQERGAAPEPIKQTTVKPPAAQQGSQPPTTTAAPAPPQQAPAAPNGDVEYATEKQVRMVMALQHSTGMTDETLKGWLAEKGIHSRKLIPKKMFQEVIDHVDPEFKFHQKQQPRKQDEDF